MTLTLDVSERRDMRRLLEHAKRPPVVTCNSGRAAPPPLRREARPLGKPGALLLGTPASPRRCEGEVVRAGIAPSKVVNCPASRGQATSRLREIPAQGCHAQRETLARKPQQQALARRKQGDRPTVALSGARGSGRALHSFRPEPWGELR